MKVNKTFFLPVLLVTLISGCCAKFDDLPNSTAYPVGSTINSAMPDIEVKPFQWANGNWTSTGEAVIDNRNYAMGSGNDLNARNVNLHFLFNYPLNRFSFKFGELGGNINIKINNDFRNIQDLVTLNGTAVGNVNVTVNANQQGNNWYGNVLLEGNIQDFSIGGQELWIDNVCIPVF